MSQKSHLHTQIGSILDAMQVYINLQFTLFACIERSQCFFSSYIFHTSPSCLDQLHLYSRWEFETDCVSLI